MSALAKDVLKGDYKIKDLSLADWGRREIRLAENEMPALFWGSHFILKDRD